VTPLQGVHALTARLLAYLVNGADVGVIQGIGRHELRGETVREPAGYRQHRQEEA
jgi:hypothetical protein